MTVSASTPTMRALIFFAAAALVFTGCARRNPAGFQGYLEGEFVYVSSPLAGQLEKLAVQKGTRIEAGAPLFTLERSAELAAQRQAGEQLSSARAHLEDLRKGSRPTELAALEARLAQARTAAELSQLDLTRQESLFKSHVIADSDIDRARLVHQNTVRAIDDLSAQLATAQLGGRVDAIAAAEADVRAAIAAKERSDWNVVQKSQPAPRAGLVYDTFYREGEFVAAASPIVALLPPENLKVRFFVAETDFAKLKAGDTVRVALDGGATVEARISYLSAQPEFTPPILYNRENRAKLVFMVEALFTDAARARDLHPGQPVDVTRINP